MPLVVEVRLGDVEKKIAVPYKPQMTIEELIGQVVKRAKLSDGSESDPYIVLHSDVELFAEDSLEDLAIADSTELVFTTACFLAASSEKKEETVDKGKEKDTDDATTEPKDPNNIVDFRDMPLKQLDMVVMDVSSSMKSMAFPNASWNNEMSRIETAQAFFQAYIDKFFCYEFPVGVGLVCFGAQIDLTFPINREYDTFSSELGEIVANQSRTRLWEAIKLAGEHIVEYRSDPKHQDKLVAPDELFCRILCLTDGADNSGTDPYPVYQFLKEKNIILDSIPIGPANSRQKLAALTVATGGSCFEVDSPDGGITLFEREAVLSLAERDNLEPFAKAINSKNDYDRIQGSSVTYVAKKVDTQSLQAKTVQTVSQDAQDKIIAKKANVAGMRRILKEFSEATSDSTNQFVVYANQDNMQFWKVVLFGPKGSPYEGGNFMVTLQFPDNYPFSPPKFQFLTPIFHCNVNNDGKVCLDILKDQWSPALTSTKVLLSVLSLMTDPNPNDPLDSSKAALYQDNFPEYVKQAQNSAAATPSLEELCKQFNL
eukprot:CAMPEP_0174256956 /NCGR_PEP_ID=MMETSP0439-20130205/6150_1 /TAXON_ID=0 /ORGANISM="Stereomyxa ramosa, Strain Chinc5" /LENGTH=541 /DNA_ID=CAMNT_0015339821 /DNA_START=69 /DNA_END=1694 /DNA_ORIENTATION=-